MSEERIDKMISLCTDLSRNEVKKLIRGGSVTVGDVPVRDGSRKIPDNCSDIKINSKPLVLNKYIYIMLNKPKGVVCASDGRDEKTVIDILPAEYKKRRGLFPAGRLDRDTVGFCFITDDGAFAHRILAPKSHVPKTYLARLDRQIDTAAAKKSFESGMTLSGEKLLPALLTLKEEGDKPLFEVVLREGKYHQIKLMFAKLGAEVEELERIRIGGLELDSSLLRGECRYLTNYELSLIAGSDLCNITGC